MYFLYVAVALWLVVLVGDTYDMVKNYGVNKFSLALHALRNIGRLSLFYFIYEFVNAVGAAFDITFQNFQQIVMMIGQHS